MLEPSQLDLLTQILEAEQRGEVDTAASLRARLLAPIRTRSTPWEQVLNWQDVPRIYRSVERPDPKVEEAKPRLLAFLQERRKEVFYERQLEVLFEREFFHWISGIALSQLRAGGRIASDVLPLWPHLPRPEMRFYNYPALYWTRRAQAVRKIVRRFSTEEFGKALGDQAELLFDAGMGSAGFRVVARDVRSWQGRDWLTTGHDLDRVYERDGVFYGAEIKNTLPYIPPDEFKAKVAMNLYFGLRPLFICRMLPKNYINAVVVYGGGFALIFEWQMYPFGHDEFATLVTDRLGFKVGRTLFPSTIQRFVDWHERQRHIPPL